MLIMDSKMMINLIIYNLIKTMSEINDLIAINKKINKKNIKITHILSNNIYYISSPYFLFSLFQTNHYSYFTLLHSLFSNLNPIFFQINLIYTLFFSFPKSLIFLTFPNKIALIIKQYFPHCKTIRYLFHFIITSNNNKFKFILTLTQLPCSQF